MAQDPRNSLAIHGHASRGQAKTATAAAQQRKTATERTLRTDDGEALSASEARNRVEARRSHEHTLAFRFESAPPISSLDLVRFEGVTLSRGSAPLLHNLTLNIDVRARVALLGANGAGKSTLIEALVADGGAGGVCVTAGEVTRAGHLRVACLHQDHLDKLHEHLDATSTQYIIAESSRREGVACSELHARQLLGGVGLGGSHLAHRTVRELSGGERTRLLMAAEILPSRPHLLLLDEPTNHLDLESLGALLAALDAFEGAVVCVSHHRHFVASFADELWTVRPGGCVDVRHAEDSLAVEAIMDRLWPPALPPPAPPPPALPPPRHVAPRPSAAADGSAAPHSRSDATEEQGAARPGEEVVDAAEVPRWMGASARRREAERHVREQLDDGLAQLLASHALLLEAGPTLIQAVGATRLADLDEVSLEDLLGVGLASETAQRIKSGLSGEAWQEMQQPRPTTGRTPQAVQEDGDGFRVSSGRARKVLQSAVTPKAVSAEVKQLVEAMGLSEEEAAKVLRKAEGDLNRAIDLCFAGAE